MVGRYRIMSYGDTEPGMAYGQYWNDGPYAGFIGRSVCIDESGNYGGDNPLSIEHDLRWAGSVSGFVGGPNSYTLDKWPVIYVPNHLNATTSEPSDNAVLSALLARGNPSKPSVDIPLFLWELKDIPKMIKSAGDALKEGTKRFRDPRKPAGDYLSWEFGWKPLISDLQKLLDFERAVDSRIQELEKLRQKGMRRNMTIWEDVSKVTLPDETLIGLYGAGVSFRIERKTTRKKWASAKWSLTAPLPPRGSQDLRNLAWQATYGLAPSPSLLWEAMPWSWMFDWCGNIGDYLGSQRNIVPAAASGGCVMKMTETVDTLTCNKVGVIYEPQTPAYVWKTRTVLSGISPEVHLPFLDGWKASILSALAITRIM